MAALQKLPSQSRNRGIADGLAFAILALLSILWLIPLSSQICRMGIIVAEAHGPRLHRRKQRCRCRLQGAE